MAGFASAPHVLAGGDAVGPGGRAMEEPAGFFDLAMRDAAIDAINGTEPESSERYEAV